MTLSFPSLPGDLCTPIDGVNVSWKRPKVDADQREDGPLVSCGDVFVVLQLCSFNSSYADSKWICFLGPNGVGWLPRSWLVIP